MEFTRQGSWKTQDGRMAKKISRKNIWNAQSPVIFFFILPSWVFQPSSCISSLIISHEHKKVIKSEEARRKWPSSNFALVYYCAMVFRSCPLFSSFFLLHSNYCVLLEGLQMFSRVVWSCSSYFFSSDPLLLFFGFLFCVRELFLFRKVSTSFVLLLYVS